MSRSVRLATLKGYTINSRESYIEACKQTNLLYKPVIVKIQYVREPGRQTLASKISGTTPVFERGKPKGVVVLLKGDEDTLYIAGSCCDKRDQFNKHIGLFLCLNKYDQFPITDPEAIHKLPAGCRETAAILLESLNEVQN